MSGSAHFWLARIYEFEKKLTELCNANLFNILDKIKIKIENKFNLFKKDIEADIGVDELKKDVFNELKMEEFEKNKEPDND